MTCASGAGRRLRRLAQRGEGFGEIALKIAAIGEANCRIDLQRELGVANVHAE